jgi:hypothetical protein
MDLGVVFGLSGMAVGVISLVYARTQALHVKRQADAANRAATMEIQSAMMQRLYDIRSQLVNSPVAVQQYLAANASMREIYQDAEYLKSTIFVRNGIDGLQDIYFLRKRSLVDDHHWRNWISAFVPLARMPLTRAIFENAVSRQALEPEFEDFFRHLLDGRPAPDPASESI